MLTYRNSFITEISQRGGVYETSLSKPVLEFIVKQDSDDLTIM